MIETIVVRAAAEDAFARFVDEIGTWWPREYTWSRDVLERMTIEPRVGGHCYELGPHEFRCDWGRVTAIDPPHRIVFTWQISPTRAPEPDPAHASEVEVRFDGGDDGSTKVALEHRHFDRHGDGGPQYREAMSSEMGWRWILQQYAAHVVSG
jgi:uncharacterized protein YndB with AHSA1/START domain